VSCDVSAYLDSHVFGAKEFQSMTSETDADANEDEHIKALYADVDFNKDGKV